MKVIRYSEANYGEQLRKLTAPSSLFDPEIEQQTRTLIEAVRIHGDDALVEFTERFDGVRLSPSQFAITPEEIDQAASTTKSDLRQAIRTAKRNIESFSRHSLRKGWTARNEQGGLVGEKFDPFQRIGIYIPGGKAPLVSTALMTILLAKVAGCPQIAVCSPCGPTGQMNRDLLHVLKVCGVTEAYRIGGVQAIAAMALGTPTIPRVQKIFGPGNIYVVTAKRLLFGYVSIDLLPGPSEVLILADNTAEPRFVAADLLAQAEHGSGLERCWLITSSHQLIQSVQLEIKRQLEQSARRKYIQQSLDGNAWMILVPDITAGIELANRLCPEHCEIMTRNPAQVAKSIKTSGAICLGPYTPNVLGDYLAGPSHVLPTGGAGASFPGLTVDQFQRRTSIIQYSRPSLQKSLPAVQAFAGVEGLEAHQRSAAVRLEKP